LSHTSMKLSAKTDAVALSRFRKLFWVFLVLTIIAYYLPWEWHRTAGMTSGAFDLAEWTTLYPGSYTSKPVLLSSFLLRISLAFLAVLVVLRATQVTSLASRLFALGIASLLGLSLLPPLEFFTTARTDPNYMQQFAISTCTMLLAFGILGSRTRISRRLAAGLGILTACAAVAAGVIGLSQGLKIIGMLGISVVVGGGAILFVTGVIFLIVLQVDAVIRA
jgi:hypothetical protein